MTREQAKARADLLRAWGQAGTSEGLFLAIVRADEKRKHARWIAQELRRLRVRVGALERAARAWERA